MDSSKATSSWTSRNYGFSEQYSSYGSSNSIDRSEKSGRNSPRMFSKSESGHRVIKNQDTTSANHKTARENRIAKMRIRRRNAALSNLTKQAGSIATTLQASFNKPEWPGIASQCKLGSDSANKLAGFFNSVLENLAEAGDRSKSTAQVNAVVAGAIEKFNAAAEWLQELDSRMEDSNAAAAPSQRHQASLATLRAVRDANFQLLYLCSDLKDLTTEEHAPKHRAPLLRTSANHNSGKIALRPARKFSGYDTRTRAAALQTAEVSSQESKAVMREFESLMEQLSGKPVLQPQPAPRRLGPTGMERSASWSTAVERRIKPAKALREKAIIRPAIAEYCRIEFAHIENLAKKQAAGTSSSFARMPTDPERLAQKSAIQARVVKVVKGEAGSSATTSKSAASDTRSRAVSAVQVQTGSVDRPQPPQRAVRVRHKSHRRAVSQPLTKPAVATSRASTNSRHGPLPVVPPESTTTSEDLAWMNAVLNELGLL
ncbi:MAG: hypothetical protein JWQ23_4023 [Herminiimonas sp.]|nr:hypothetical protein [Herminiimonas sp.]